MRESLLIIFVVVIICVLQACSVKKEEAHDESKTVEIDEWAEMDSFHMIMAESFHPFIDSGNLVPAKQNALAMEELASKWAEAPLPAKVNNDQVRQLLSRLKNSTTNFRSMLDDAPDEVLGDSLASLHDLFHDIQESWYKDEESHDH